MYIVRMYIVSRIYIYMYIMFLRRSIKRTTITNGLSLSFSIPAAITRKFSFLFTDRLLSILFLSIPFLFAIFDNHFLHSFQSQLTATKANLLTLIILLCWSENLFWLSHFVEDNNFYSTQSRSQSLKYCAKNIYERIFATKWNF